MPTICWRSGFLDAARADFGFIVPEDLVLVGFDDLPMASAAAFGLTTLRQDGDVLASVVDRLIERMAKVSASIPARSQSVSVALVARAYDRALDLVCSARFRNYFSFYFILQKIS